MPIEKVTPRWQVQPYDSDGQVAEFAREVEIGLTASPKRLPCRYFYDQQGSLLFEEICVLPEYYLTRTEREILRERAEEIASLFGEPIAMMELGSGSAAKTRLLIEAFLRRHASLRYVPIDISPTILEESSLALLQAYPRLEIAAVAAEYEAGLRQLQAETGRPKMILWLGSNAGNLDRSEATRFLSSVRETMTDRDRLLVGIDLRKERAVLERAYDDAGGVTARFNLNLLARINRELGGHFDLTRFRHRAVYNEPIGRVEIFLDSLTAQRVRIEALDREIAFAAGEPIHTENSYKYSLAEILGLVRASGLDLERQWLDPDRRFSVNLLRRAIIQGPSAVGTLDFVEGGGIDDEAADAVEGAGAEG
jgi:dimethylhistidine N-methyltransferase